MKHQISLILILILGLSLRITGLEILPAGFTPDEASFGYDAFSLIHTSKDQWGESWPLTLKSFGDYKLPLYTYILIPFVYLFGLTESIVRLPNALFGSLAIIATYFLCKQTFGKDGKYIGLIAALLVAISPWHIPLSRGAFEANLTTFLLPTAIYLFFKGIKEIKFMNLAAILFGINLFSYHSARMVTPFIVTALVVSNFKFLRNKRQNLLSGIIFSIFAIIGIYSIFTGAAARASTSTIFSTSENVFSDRVPLILSGEPLLIAKLFNNEGTFLINKFINQYISYFSFEFLFINGPAEGTYGMIPGVGVMYLFELPILFYLVYLILSKKVKLPSWLMLWVFLAPIPAAISIGPGYAANRAAIIMPAIQILSGVGAYFLIKDFINARVIKFLAFGVVFISFLFFIERYVYHQIARQADSMLFGARDIYRYTQALEDQYNEIIITKKLSEPHIYHAFYNKIPPQEFQETAENWNFEEHGLDWVDMLPEYSLGNYTFKNINLLEDFANENVLVVAPADMVIDRGNIIKTIYYPNGKAAYILIDNKSVEFATNYE